MFDSCSFAHLLRRSHLGFQCMIVEFGIWTYLHFFKVNPYISKYALAFCTDLKNLGECIFCCNIGFPPSKSQQLRDQQPAISELLWKQKIALHNLEGLVPRFANSSLTFGYQYLQASADS